MSVKVVCEPNALANELGIKLIGYEESIQLAFDKIDQNQVNRMIDFIFDLENKDNVIDFFKTI